MPPFKAEVIIYTDGACHGNPGPGGWAFILHHVKTGHVLDDSGAEPYTTNNRMELRAVIEGLKRLKRKTLVQIVTDSNYVKEGLSSWMAKWKENGWRRKVQGHYEPVKNVELWQELDRLLEMHKADFQWVRGHSGNIMNETCDRLAREACKKLMRKKKKGSASPDNDEL